MWNRFSKRIFCWFTKHHFIRFPLLDGNIQIICTKCNKSFVKKRVGKAMNISPNLEQQRVINLTKNHIFNRSNSSNDLLVGAKSYREFSTDSFDYWVCDKNVIPTNAVGMSYEEIVDDLIQKTGKLINYYRGTSRYSYMLRFSKRFGNLEYYIYSHEIRETLRSKGKLLLIHKRHSVFKMRPNNVVLINGCRYISFKNFNTLEGLSDEIRLALLNAHLQSNFSIELIKEFRNIPNKFTKKCSTLEDILHNMSKTVPSSLKKNFKTEALLILYTFLEEREICKFINFIRQNVDIYHPKNEIEIDINNPFDDGHISFYDQTGISKIIAELMGIRLKLICRINMEEIGVSKFVSIKGTKENRNLLRDYINMTFQLGEKININITSLTRLKYLHDAAMVKIGSKKIPKIKVAKKYPKSFSTASKKHISINLISDSVELVKEGKEMNHCVASYWKHINQGFSAIYKVYDSKTGERGTLELQMNPYDKDKKSFKINQFKGIWNSNPSRTLQEDVFYIITSNVPTTTRDPMPWYEPLEELPF